MAERKEISERHSVIFALVKDGIIQLEKRREFGRWFGLTIIPGGHVEPGETIDEATLNEARQEYDIVPKTYKNLGSIITSEEDLSLHIKHVFLVTDWSGQLSDPEGRNPHIEASLKEARELCTHPISQRVLNMVEEELSR